MAVYDHAEQEQLDEIKAWWKAHGNKVVNVLLVVATVVAAGSGWKLWQDRQKGEAAMVYGQLETAAGKRDIKAVRDLAVELADKYSGTPYAAMGALVAAKVQVDADDPKNAKAQLAWAAEHADDVALRDLARMRLAGMLLDDKAYDEALKQLEKEAAPGFGARFAELKGDILSAQGKKDEARAAYQAALAKLDAVPAGERASVNTPVGQRDAAFRELVQLKIDAMGGKS